MFQYEQNKALLNIYAGAGGVDAQDWATMLFRMYDRYCQKKGWKLTILNESYGEQGGTKNKMCEISGQAVFETLKGESGVHRLVRISPYSAKKLRHTSFALVEILPEIIVKQIHIDQKDLRVDTYRSSGPGGQNVNKLETAVRITHLPTNIAVAVQSERNQASNKEKALSLLYSRLVQRMQEENVAQADLLKPELKSGSIDWGSQIRSYVLHPYQMVKDHRTGKKSSQPDKVLSGDLDIFINQ